MHIKKIAVIFSSSLLLLSFSAFSQPLSTNTMTIVGGNSTILTSSNGVDWSQQSSPINNASITTVAHANNQFVALAANCCSLTSLDGITWEKHPLLNKFGNPPDKNIIWVKNQYFALTEDTGSIYSSPDGINWKKVYSADVPDQSNMLSSIAYGNGIYLATGGYISSSGGPNAPITCYGNVMTSQDGLNWSKKKPYSVCTYAAIWGHNEFVILGTSSGYPNQVQSGVLASVDGFSWSWNSVGFPGQTLESVTWGNNQYVAVGIDDEAHNNMGIVFTSKDAVHWVKQTIPTVNGLNKVVWINNHYVALNYFGAILTSPDGIHWALQNSGTGAALFDVA